MKGDNMKINLDEITINDEKVFSRLLDYLKRMTGYSNFDDQMPVRVYVNSEKDFTAFEAVNYRLSFTSSAHKLLDTIKSKYAPEVVPFSEFYNHVLNMDEMPFQFAR